MNNKIVTLYIASFLPLPGGDVQVREHPYAESKTTLTAVESNDGPGAPIGLRRIKTKNLPSVGGLFGTACVARTEKEAIETLRKTLSKERNKLLQKSEIFRVGLSQTEEMLSALVTKKAKGGVES